MALCFSVPLQLNFLSPCLHRCTFHFWTHCHLVSNPTIAFKTGEGGWQQLPQYFYWWLKPLLPAQLLSACQTRVSNCLQEESTTWTYHMDFSALHLFFLFFLLFCFLLLDVPTVRQAPGSCQKCGVLVPSQVGWVRVCVLKWFICWGKFERLCSSPNGHRIR